MTLAASGAAAAAAASDEGEPTVRNGGAAECGRALGRLRRALDWLCHVGQGVGDARPLLASTRRVRPDRCRPRNGARFSSSEHRWPPDSEFTQ